MSRLGLMTGLIVAALLMSFAPPAVADEAEDQFQVAAGLYRRDRWKLAADEFRAFLERFPEHSRVAEAIFYLGETHVQLAEFEAARSRFRELAKRDPEFEHRAQVLFRIGETSYLLGEHPQAAIELDRFAREFPKHALMEFVLPYLGDAQLRVGKPKVARQLFEKALAQFPKSNLADDARFGLAQVLEELEEADAAIALYRTVAADRSSDLADDAQLNLGARLFTLKQYAAAAEAFEDLVSRFPRSPLVQTARLNRGWALYQIERFDAAQALFADLASDEKLGGEAQYWLGLALKSQSEWDQASTTLLGAFEKHPDHRLAAEMLFHAADALMSDGKFREAKARFLEVARRHPESELADDGVYYAAHVSLLAKDYDEVDRLARRFAESYAESELRGRVRELVGQALLEQQEYEQAVAVLKPLVENASADADSVRVRNQLATAYQGLDQHDAALSVFEPLIKSAEDQPAFAETLYLSGVSWFANEDYRRARDAFARYLKLRPEGEWADQALAHVAICRAQEKDYAGARATLQRLVRNPRQSAVTATATLRIAETAYWANDWDFAREMYERLYSQGSEGPHFAQALSGLGWCHFQTGGNQAAAEWFGKLLERYPDHALAPEVAWVRGRALERLEKWDEALASFQWLLANHPGSPHVFPAALQVARVNVKRQQYREAAEAYGYVMEQFADAEQLDEVMFEQAWVYVDLKETERANQLFLALAEKHPKSPYAHKALLNVAESFYQTGNYDEAISLLNGLIERETSETVAEATLYRLGRIAADREQWAQVEKPFRRLIERFPSSAMRDEAEFWIAEADYRQGRYEQAVGQFLQITQSSEPVAWLPTAWLRLGQVYAHQKQWDRAVEAAETLKRRFPDYEAVFEADYVLGRCFANTARFEEAREAYGRVVQSPGARKTETAAQSQFMIGESYFHQKQFGEALRAFLRVEILYDYPKWQASALLEAGKCHERLSEWGEAVASYQRLLDRYRETPFADEAAERLEIAQKRAEQSPPRRSG